MNPLKCFALALLLSLGFVSGCGEACDTSVKTGLFVTVIGGGGVEEGLGGSSAFPPCLADVTTSPMSSDFTCSTDGDDCACSGFAETPGRVSVTVELGGLSETKSVEIDKDECHVIPEKLCFFGEC